MSTTPPPPPPGSAGDFGQPARPHPRGTLILVLGIASLFICGIVLGVVAFVMGNNALKEIDQNPGAYTNRSSVNAGRICGLVGAILSIVVVVIVAASG